MRSYPKFTCVLAVAALLGCSDSTTPGADLPQFASFEVRALDHDPAMGVPEVRTLEVYPPVTGSGQWYFAPGPNIGTPPEQQSKPSVFFMRATSDQGTAPIWSELQLRLGPGHDWPFRGGTYPVGQISSPPGEWDPQPADLGIAAGRWVEGTTSGYSRNFNRIYEFEDGEVTFVKLDRLTIEGHAEIIATAVEEYEGHAQTLAITARFRLQTLPW